MPGTLVARAIVDRDETSGVRRYPGRLQAEVGRVGHAADREQHVAPDDVGRPLRAVDADPDALRMRREADAFRPCPDRDALRFQDVAHRLRHVLVLAADQPRTLLDDRHLRAEATIDLTELQADVAAADDHQVLRQRREVEQ